MERGTVSDLRVYTLPEEMVLPFVASWRTMERSINPVFKMVMYCSACQKPTSSEGNQGPQFVLSKKQKNGMPIIIGIQCKTEGCDMVIKFENPISPGDSHFPSRFQKYPPTALVDPTGKTGKKIGAQGLAEIKSLLELE
jgi:hypothetical protein